MFWRKKQKTYFDYFEEEAQIIHKAAVFLDAIFQSPSSSAYLAKEINQLEEKADKVAHNAYNQLNRSGFILPIDREDIHSFLKTLDDVIDDIDDVSETSIEVFKMKESTPLSKKLTEEIVKGSKLILSTCPLMRFPSKHSEQILDNCHQIYLLENGVDNIKKEALQQLFAQLKANEINFADYIAWKDIYTALEIVTDRMEDFGNVAEEYVIKYS